MKICRNPFFQRRDFGSIGTTDKGIHEMLDKKISNIQNFKAWNFFHTRTETVRLEEAILGCCNYQCPYIQQINDKKIINLI